MLEIRRNIWRLLLDGINKALTAVKNGLIDQYNNGLAECSVNKINIITRIMHGRNSLKLLNAKVFSGKYFHYIFN